MSERPSKYHAKRAPCEVGGAAHVHASQKERARHWELAQLEAQGHIRGLVLQPRFDLVVNGQRVGRYTPDFAYDEIAAGHIGTIWRPVVEDVKGGVATKTEAYSLRKRLLLALYGVKVRET